MPSECQSHSQLRLCQNVTSDKLFKQQITCSLRACFSVGKDDLPLKSLAPEIFCTNPPTVAAFWICLPFAFSTFLAQHMYAIYGCYCWWWKYIHIYLHTSCRASVTFGLVEAQKCTRLLKIQQLIAGAAYKAARGKTTGETMN